MSITFPPEMLPVADGAADVELDVQRRPILISDGTVLLLSIFTKPRGDRFDDLWTWDHIQKCATGADAALEFVAQLEDHWTPQFLMELRKAISEKLATADKERGTAFAPYKFPGVP